jgi:hypothetical protein
VRLPHILRAMGMTNTGLGSSPVFYDIEASSLEGFPIEIGWAQADAALGTIMSEGYLIRPPPDWDIPGTWDPGAAARHRISIDDLWRKGRPVLEIARRMNQTLAGAELFADSSFDETWLHQLLEAAGIDPDFSVRRTDPAVLIGRLAVDRATYVAAKRNALRDAPQIHRAEADARHWAVVWQTVMTA